METSGEVSIEMREMRYVVKVFVVLLEIHGLRTTNENINQRYLKNWADVADKICCRHT